MSFTLLIIDDEETLRASLAMALGREGYNVLASETGQGGLNIIRNEFVDLVLLDMRLPDKDGLEVLDEIKKVEGDVPTIMMTAYADVPTAVKAMKLGAYDYINKPFELDEMKLIIAKVLEVHRLRLEVNRLRQDRDTKRLMGKIIGKSEKMCEVLNLVEKVSQTPKTSVLIQGETGTGKELIANAIHRNSYRSNRPLMDINCSAIPENLLEAQLFGHEKGAFTDARSQRKGLFELADGGTVFLDEIGDLNTSLQPKILRFLESQTFKRVGGTRDLSVDVRVIAATNKDLAAATQKGEFREDLYYRLKVLEIHVPPLRDRREDILPLASFFVRQFSQEFKKKVTSLSPQVEYLLNHYSWPGNVRELKNSIERAVLLTDDEEILPRHLPLEIRPHDEHPEQTSEYYQEDDQSLEAVECRHILNLLHACAGNKSETARRLGISRSTLREKLMKYGK